MAPIKSSLARSVGKLLGVYKDTDLSLRGATQSTRHREPPFSASGGNIDGATPGNGFKYHVFTSSGTFTVSVGGEVEYLVVAGGASGGYDRAAGGGAGGLRCNSPTCPAPRRTPSLSLNPGPYSITVGDGGSTHTGYGAMSPPVAGQPSSIASTVVASGGGGYSPTASENNGGSGRGSGSGGQPGRGTTIASPDGLSPTVQGFDGGGPSDSTTSLGTGAGGGGGAGGAGGASSPPSGPSAGVGGAGLAVPAFNGALFPTMPASWTCAVGPTGVYAGGGGGGGSQDGQGPNTGGPAHSGGGGGGVGGTGPGTDGTAAVANTGGGGGGGNNVPQGDGGAGGSGIVIIRYAV